MCCKVQRLQLASSPLAPEIRISQSGIQSRAVLKAVFDSVLLFSMAVAKTESSPGPPPIPSRPIPWFFILAFPFLFSRSNLGSFYPFSFALAFVACLRTCLCILCMPMKSCLAGAASSWCSQQLLGLCFFLILSCSALLLGIGLQ